MKDKCLPTMHENKQKATGGITMVICALLFLLAIIMMAGHMLPYGDAYHTFMVVFALVLAGVTLMRLEKKRIPKWIFIVNAIAVMLTAFMELGSNVSEWIIKFIGGGAAVLATLLAVWTMVQAMCKEKEETKEADKTKPST